MFTMRCESGPENDEVYFKCGFTASRLFRLHKIDTLHAGNPKLLNLRSVPSASPSVLSANAVIDTSSQLFQL